MEIDAGVAICAATDAATRRRIEGGCSSSEQRLCVSDMSNGKRNDEQGLQLYASCKVNDCDGVGKGFAESGVNRHRAVGSSLGDFRAVLSIHSKRNGN